MIGRSFENTSVNHICLNGLWELGYCDAGSSDFSRQPEYTLTCPVPGDIHMAFLEKGLIPDPLTGLGSEECRWLEQKEFWYRTRFFLDSEASSAGEGASVKNTPRSRKLLTFEGLDCSADIFLNGAYIGRHDNSFVEITFDVTEAAVPGENELVLRIDSGFHAVKDKPLEDMGKMWNSNQPYRVWMRKPQFVYAWDWTIWLETCGIWRDVYLDCFTEPRLDDVYIYPASTDVPVSGEEHKTLIEIAVRDISEPVSATVTVSRSSLYDDGAPVFTGTVAAEAETVMEITIPDARLWWCNGIAEPYQYLVTVTLHDRQGKILDSAIRHYGVRSISLREETLSAEESGFTFLLNGEPVFCKGANHVPADCLIGRITDEKSRALVDMAADSHMNMLRVWGGGIYESEAFLDACDSRGIMVWHDFMYACGYYPDFDPEFLENATAEAVKAVKRLRNHTSVIGWSGNNEIQEMYQSTLQHDSLKRPYGMELFTKMLPGVVSRYHHGAVYRETSPDGRKDRPANIETGDQHIWYFTHRPGIEHFMDLTHYTDYNVKFLSEFGLIGAMNYESSCRSIGSTDRESKAWLHHCNSSIDYRVLDNVMKVHFDNVDGLDTQDYILKSQAIQSDITHYLYDEFRRRKFVCSGLLFWTLSDSFGIHNWSLIDYYLDKRPIYYVLKRATGPISVSVKGMYPNSFEGQRDYKSYYTGSPAPLEIWLCNDTLRESRLRLRYRLMTFDGEILEEFSSEILSPANQSFCAYILDIAGKIPDPEAALLAVDAAENDKTVATTEYLFAPFKRLKTKKAVVHCGRIKCPGAPVKLRLRSDSFVWFAHLAGTDRVCFSDNDFHMLPGTTYEVEARGADQENDCPVILSPGTNPVVQEDAVPH